MSTKVPCTKCGVPILPTTAQATGGVCMPCKQGNRENLERAKEYYQKQKRYDPFRELWKSLVHRVYKTERGYKGLAHAERVYWCVGILEGEVYNGGFHQFFTNSSGEHFQDVTDALHELRAFESLRLLLEAADLLFEDGQVPADRAIRNTLIKDYPKEGYKETDWCIRLDQLDKAYWANPDALGERLERYAEEQDLVTPFKHEANKAMDSTATRVTPPAGQEPRHGQP
jgi:hypothetical protein